MANEVNLKSRTAGQQLVDALRLDGFVLVTGHSLDLEAAACYQDRLSQFFALSNEYKNTFRRPVIGGLRGYVGMGEEVRPFKLDGRYDFVESKECYHMGRRDNRHPPDLGLDETGAVVFNDLEKTLEQCLSALGSVLPPVQSLHEGMFPQDQPWTGAHLLRMIEYHPDPSPLRLGPHRDLSLLTIMPSPSAQGLQFQGQDGSWVLAPLHRDGLLVTAGYLLASICDHKGYQLRAGVHQVANVENASRRRSLSFFGMVPLDYVVPVWYERASGEKSATGAEIMYERLQRSYTSLESQPYGPWLEAMQAAN